MRKLQWVPEVICHNAGAGRNQLSGEIINAGNLYLSPMVFFDAIVAYQIIGYFTEEYQPEVACDEDCCFQTVICCEIGI